MRKLLLVIIFVALTGCLSTHDVVRVSPDTYMVRIEDHGGIFAFNRGKMKSAAMQKANDFAESKGKVAIPVNLHEHPVGILGDWAAVEYQFRVVSEDDPEARRTSLTPRADVVIEKTSNMRGNIVTKDASKGESDLYDQLIRLDDLRSKGILTNEEFIEQKKILLKK